MEDERENQIEFRKGDKHGVVDFGTIEVVKEIHRMTPKNSFDSHDITFADDDLHAGLIAALVSEMLPAFRDGHIESMTVSTTTLKVLETLGISYQKVNASAENIIHAEDNFSISNHDVRLSGD